MKSYSAKITLILLFAFAGKFWAYSETLRTASDAMRNTYSTSTLEVSEEEEDSEFTATRDKYDHIFLSLPGMRFGYTCDIKRKAIPPPKYKGKVDRNWKTIKKGHTLSFFKDDVDLSPTFEYQYEIEIIEGKKNRTSISNKGKLKLNTIAFNTINKTFYQIQWQLLDNSCISYVQRLTIKDVDSCSQVFTKIPIDFENRNKEKWSISPYTSWLIFKPKEEGIYSLQQYHYSDIGEIITDNSNFVGNNNIGKRYYTDEFNIINGEDITLCGSNLIDSFSIEQLNIVKGKFEPLSNTCNIFSNNGIDTQQYNYKDEPPCNGINFYRLKITFKDGSPPQYSEVKKVPFSNSIEFGPTQNHWIKKTETNSDTDMGSTYIAIDLPLYNGKESDVSLYNSVGINIGTFKVTPNNTIKVLIDKKEFQSGIYFIAIDSELGTPVVKYFIGKKE